MDLGFLYSNYEIAAIFICYIILLATSGRLLHYVLASVSDKDLSEIASQEELDTGMVVGKCENLMYPAFIMMGFPSLVGLIFAGKSIVRIEDLSKNSLYYLAGAFVNTTYSIFFGIFMKLMLTGKLASII